MGNCLQTLRTPNYNFEYRPRTWDSANLEMMSISNKLGISDFEQMDDRAGPNGFPYKIRGQFAKVIMKSRRKVGFRVQMNINRLKNLVNTHEIGAQFFCLPERIEEIQYSYIFFFPLLDMDLVDWVKNHFWTSVHRDNIFTKLCAAVDFLHTNEFVHRDIKLENICMRNNEPFLIDLDNCSLAIDQTIKGTRDYMPPREAIRHLYNKRDDIKNNVKTKWMDCYALAKTFALILCIENERMEEGKQKIIKNIWYKWCKTSQGSLRIIQNHSDTLEIMSKWWVLVYNFAYYNEEAVFDNGIDILDIKIYKNLII